MDSIRFLAKSLLFWLVRVGVSWPLVTMCVRDVEEVASAPGGGRRRTLLALNPERFREDLDILAATGELRLLKLPFHWPGRLITHFYPAGVSTAQIARPGGDPKVLHGKRAMRDFLRGFLPPLYRRLKVDAVIGAAIHYPQDQDWGAVSDELGYPYIVLHRENLVTAPEHKKGYFEKSRGLGKFSGSHIVVHNQTVRQIFVDSGYVGADRISSLGCLRMDRFLERIESAPAGVRNNRVVLFSFTHGTGLLGMVSQTEAGFRGHWSTREDVGFVRFFDNVHGCFAQLARDFPEVEFVIKPKWLRGWREHIVESMARYGITPQSVPNLSITDEMQAHDLILSSDVVCGFGSTTLLEAGIAGKPVIIPLFDEAARPDYSDYIHLRDHFDLFDVATDTEMFVSLICERLKDPSDFKGDASQRRRAFSDLVSSVGGGAVSRYAGLIEREILRSCAPTAPPD